jgi:hypothetical protein
LAACKLLGLPTIPVIVRDLTDAEAIITMVDANLQREHILPSEKAFAYRIGNVRYVVESHFLPFPKSEQKTMRDRVERLLTSDFTDLTVFEAADTMDAENVCSAAGKED